MAPKRPDTMADMVIANCAKQAAECLVPFRAGFRGGGHGAQGPRPPTKRGPPTKPFNFYFALTIG